MPMLGQKTSILSKIHYIYGTQESIGCHFYFDFSRKNNCSHAHISSKKRPFAKNHTAFMPKFCKINVQFFQKNVLSCHFFFKKHPLLSCPCLIKNVNSVKTTPIYWSICLRCFRCFASMF